MASTISTSTSTSTWLPGQSPVHVPEIDIAISPLTGGDTDFDALLASFSEGGKGNSGNQCLQQQHVDVLTSGGDGGEEAALKASARDFDHFFGQSMMSMSMNMNILTEADLLALFAPSNSNSNNSSSSSAASSTSSSPLASSPATATALASTSAPSRVAVDTHLSGARTSLPAVNTDDADADVQQQQQQHRKPTAAMTGQKRSAAAAAEEEAVAAPAPAPAGRQPRRAATRAALALEAAMSPSSLADEMDEDGNHADQHDDEEDAASDNGSDYDEDDDASVSASATRASAQRRNRTNTASSAAAAKKSGRTSTAGSTSRRSAGGRDSGMNDPNRNARLAKENRERKKQYIAGLEATIEELRAQCREHEQKQAELRRQADLVSAENATLRTTLAHQQAFAPIVAAMQAVPGLSFTAPAVTAPVTADANSSNNKRPRVGTSATATPTVVPLTFNVYLNPAANQ
eukprot:m.103419 g.103419  ORF g.103419 m.103419 type:complete len:461 (-) comp15715_c0_seq19:713-2095(-)